MECPRPPCLARLTFSTSASSRAYMVATYTYTYTYTYTCMSIFHVDIHRSTIHVYAYTSMLVSFLLFYMLATSTVISGCTPICDNTHSLRLYSAALLGDHAASTVTLYPTQSHYPDTILISSCLILRYMYKYTCMYNTCPRTHTFRRML